MDNFWDEVRVSEGSDMSQVTIGHINADLLVGEYRHKMRKGDTVTVIDEQLGTNFKVKVDKVKDEEVTFKGIGEKPTP